MTVGMSAPPMGVTSIKPKSSEMTTMTGKTNGAVGIEHQHQRRQDGRAQHRQADEVLALVDDGPLREQFLQLAGGDQAAREAQRADDDLHRDLDHA